MKSPKSNPYLKKFGNRVSQLRKEKGLSQRELCFKIDGWGKGHLSSTESGLRNLSITSIVKLAEALEVPVKDLFEF